MDKTVNRKGRQDNDTRIQCRDIAVQDECPLPLRWREHFRNVCLCPGAATVQTFGAVVRRNRSLLLSRSEVYGRARGTRHLRAGPVPLLSMYRGPTILLPTPRIWPALFCSELPLLEI
jgi:hypothetical protein